MVDVSYLCEVRTTERPSLMMLWMVFQRARRALGSIPVVGSSCNEEDSQVNVGPQIKQEAEGEGEEDEGEEEGHHCSITLLLWL